jgi:hypothetical protein
MTPMSNEDLEFFLGNLKEILPGETYEKKVGYLFDCINYAHEKRYTICKGLEERKDDVKECKVVLTAAGAILEEGVLLNRLMVAETQFEEIQKIKEQGRTIEELVKEYQESEKPQ